MVPLFSHVSSSNSITGNVEINVFSISLPLPSAKSEKKAGGGRSVVLTCVEAHPGPLPATADTAGQRTRGTPWAEKREENGIVLKIIAMCEASLAQVILKQHISTEKNVLVPISPLHEDQPAPQHHSGIWVELPLNPVLRITMSNYGPHIQFSKVDLGAEKGKFLPPPQTRWCQSCWAHISSPFGFVCFILFSYLFQKIYVISLQCVLSPKANPSGYLFPSKYKLFCSPVIICFAYSYTAESEAARYE